MSKAKVTFKITLTSDPKLPFKVQKYLKGLHKSDEWSVTFPQTAHFKLSMDPLNLNDSLENIFLLFQDFFDFIQQNVWCESVIGTDVEDIFSKVKNIESFCELMSTTGYSDAFDDKLKEFWLVMGKENGPDLNYFKRASDLALEKYIMYEKFDNLTVKLSIDFYFKNNNKDKFISVIKGLVQTHKMFSSLSNVLMKSGSTLELQSRMVFENWKSILSLNCECHQVIHESVNELITSDANNTKFLLKMLCFENKSKYSMLVKNIVLANLVVSMENSFVKEFWNCFIIIEENDFKYLLKNYGQLLKLICNIVEYSAQRLKISYSANSYDWVENEFDSSLSYSDLLVLLKKVKCVGDEVEKDLDEYLSKMKSSGLCVFFEDIKRDLT